MAMTESAHITARRAPFGAITVFKIVDAVYVTIASFGARQSADVRALTPALREDIGVSLSDLDAGSPMKGIVGMVRDWKLKRRTIAELSALSDHQLNDIGISRDDIHNV